MNILVLNGSPKGSYSITLQTVYYLQALHPEHSFEILNVGRQIRQLEKDFSPAAEALKKCGAAPVFLPGVHLHCALPAPAVHRAGQGKRH